MEGSEDFRFKSKAVLYGLRTLTSFHSSCILRDSPISYQLLPYLTRLLRPK